MSSISIGLSVTAGGFPGTAGSPPATPLENTAGTGVATFTGTAPVSNTAGTGTATWSDAA